MSELCCVRLSYTSICQSWTPHLWMCVCVSVRGGNTSDTAMSECKGSLKSSHESTQVYMYIHNAWGPGPQRGEPLVRVGLFEKMFSFKVCFFIFIYFFFKSTWRKRASRSGYGCLEHGFGWKLHVFQEIQREKRHCLTFVTRKFTPRDMLNPQHTHCGINPRRFQEISRLIVVIFIPLFNQIIYIYIYLIMDLPPLLIITAEEKQLIRDNRLTKPLLIQRIR